MKNPNQDMKYLDDRIDVTRDMIKYLDQKIEVARCICEHFGHCRVSDEDCPFRHIDNKHCFANQVSMKILDDCHYRKIEKEKVEK